MLFRRLTDLVTPNLMVEHVRDITPDLLRHNGVRAVLCDLDNTLVVWRSEEITEEVVGWLSALKAAKIPVCIASNTVYLTRMERLAGQLGIQHLPGNAAKPRRRGLRKGLEILGTTADETAMVGDQMFTDILAGNRVGLTTILVKPLSNIELITTRLINRNLERLILRNGDVILKKRSTK